MKVARRRLDALLATYGAIKDKVKMRLKEFEEVGMQGPDRMYEELVFCLLTPQSRARAADEAVKRLKEESLLLTGSVEEVARVLRECGVRFPNVKARYVVESRGLLDEPSFLTDLLRHDVISAREMLVGRVKGMGYKEASHFLRNVGMKGVAILDRHVLRGLKNLGVIREVPKSLSGERYLELERKFMELSKRLKVPPEELDMVLWYMATGEVFK